MKESKEHLLVPIVTHVGGSAVYTEATFKRIIEDALCLRAAAEKSASDQDKKRYARIIILLIALYLESLSNRIFLHFFPPPISEGKEAPKWRAPNADSHTDLPGPVRSLRAAYKECLKQELKLDTKAIQDIFAIRNQIIAHPSGRAQLEDTKKGWSPRITSVKWQWDGADAEIAAKQPHYNKFKHFPYVYSQFTLDQADEVLKETKEFLVDFLGALKKKVDKSEFDLWWPVELCEWSETRL